MARPGPLGAATQPRPGRQKHTRDLFETLTINYLKRCNSLTKNNFNIQLLVNEIVVSASTGSPDCPFVNESFVLCMILFHNSFANHFQNKKNRQTLINPFVTVSQSITTHLQKWHFYGVIYQMAPRALHGEAFLLKVYAIKGHVRLMGIDWERVLVLIECGNC